MRRISIIVALLVTLASTAWAGNGKLVLVVAGGTSLNEILAPGLPNISRLLETGAIGVMNVRPASVKTFSDDVPIGRYSMESGCVTIGAGTRAAASVDARKAFDTNDMVDDRAVAKLYETFYGEPPGKASVVHLGMNRLIFINSEAKHPVEPGALGTALRLVGLKTAAIGNSDTIADQRREAAVIAADAEGIIDYGHVGSKLTVHDAKAPYGVRVDSRALLREYDKAIAKADFIVVDVGDTARAARYAIHCVEEQGSKLKHQALKNADGIIGSIVDRLDLSKDRIIIASPNPSFQSMDAFDYLPPVIVAGKGIEQGMLISGSTRRPGIVTNADISASVLDFFGVTPPFSFVGRRVESTQGNAPQLSAINNKIIMQMERQPVMRGIATFFIVLVVVITPLAYQRMWNPRAWVSWLALVPIALILVVLWLPAIANVDIIASVALLSLFAVFILFLAWLLLRSPVRAFAWLSALVAITAIADALRGANLLAHSIMSYTPVDGSRYYGIGNEHMGSTIATSVITAGFIAAALTGKRPIKIAAICLFLVIMVLAVGLPSFGANAGGAISAAFAVVVGLILWNGRKINRVYVLAALAVVCCTIGLMVAIDLLRSGGTQSHMGRAIHLISTGGASQVLVIISRKIAMNLTLLQYSAWSKLLMASVASTVLFVVSKHSDVVMRLKSNLPVYNGLLAATAGACAALVFNDSGVVAAATAFTYVWVAVALAALQRNELPEEDTQ